MDSQGRLIPVFVPGVSYLDYYPATRGATMNTDNHSLFVQDHWTINNRWSADLGARFEHVSAVSTGDIAASTTHRIVPRLALAYDVSGDGDQICARHLRAVCRPVQRSAHRRQQPGRKSADDRGDLSGSGGPGLRLRSRARTGQLSDHSANAAVSDPVQNVFIEDGMKSPLVARVLALVRREPVRTAAATPRPATSSGRRRT